MSGIKKTLAVLSLLSSLLPASQAQDARLLRFPTVSPTQIAFTYAGDLYTVARGGGQARKLTSDIGFESFARFSPDGSNIAFTGQFDGNTEVYVIPATGGVPKRLTFSATLDRDDMTDRMGPNNIVMTWKDNEHIVYRNRANSLDEFVGQLMIASTHGGLSERLALPEGGFCSFSPDRQKLAYNRIFREFRTWKYYRGGMADDVWIYDFNTRKLENITNNPAQDIEPMWAGDKIYFLSDRDRIMNLFCYDILSRQTRKITQYTDYDIKFASLGTDAIVFEQAGYINVMDLGSEKVSRVNIQINSDELYSRTTLIDAAHFVESYDIAPDGKRALLVARGDIFTIPQKGMTRDISRTSGVHERNAVWSPDGKYIAFISDSTGEDEIYVQSPDGKSNPVQLTANGDVYKYELIWSPDSRKIAWGDKKMRLQFVDIDSKKQVVFDSSAIWEIRDYSWSPDSKWIAYSTLVVQGHTGKVWMYNVASGRKVPVTDTWYNSNSPVFSPDGKYLYFTSNREFNPTFSNTELEIAYLNMTKIYVVPLSRETPNPMAPENDEVAVKNPERPADKKAAAKKSPSKGTAEQDSGSGTVKDILVDEDHINDRIIALNLDGANYYRLSPIEGKVYYLKFRDGDKSATLGEYDLKEKKETLLGEADDFALSADTKKMLVHKGAGYYIIDAPHGKLELKEALDISNMNIMVDKKQEWMQIFNETWRQMRDFFYSPSMNGVNWKFIHDKYAVLVPYVNHRADLDYILGEMIGELSSGHTYTGGGDVPRQRRIRLGLLGADLSRDASGFYRIDRIMPGANFDASLRSPLTDVGVNVHAGDYIIRINGVLTSSTNDIYSLLVNTADKQVELEVNSKPLEAGSHQAIVVPLANELHLVYYDWVEHNIHYVDSVSGGKIGYVHLPDMNIDGLNEFFKHYYPQLNKSALIVDDRYNGGGFVSPIVAERLSRQLVYFEMLRNQKIGIPNPDMVLGPKVCLINEYSASDGDIFPYRFRAYQLGKLIGKRTWGGVVGIRGSLPFVDGGFLNKPEFAPYLEGRFVIEGHGIDPDIDVDNDPAHEYRGIDDQLNRAISELLTELQTKEQKVPPIPPFPDKTKP